MDRYITTYVHVHRLWIPLGPFLLLCYITPHTPGEYNTPTGLFCPLGSLTPHTPGKYPQGSFVSAMFLNPSHSWTHRALCSLTPHTPWKVHHTHRALFSQLCSLTPHTPHHIHNALFCRILFNPSHSSKVIHTHRALLCRFNPHSFLQIRPHLHVQGSLRPLSRPHQRYTAHNMSSFVTGNPPSASETKRTIEKRGKMYGTI